MHNVQTWAIDSIAGEIKRQGPHQLATNSTRTGRSDFKTMSENWVSFISLIPPQFIDNLRAAEELRNHGVLLWLREAKMRFLEQLGANQAVGELEVELHVQSGRRGGLENKAVCKRRVSMIGEAEIDQQTGREGERLDRGIQHYLW